jgi:cbb3-type cytochrome oxidase subunit 1
MTAGMYCRRPASADLCLPFPQYRYVYIHFKFLLVGSVIGVAMSRKWAEAPWKIIIIIIIIIIMVIMMNELQLSTCGGCFGTARSLVESFPSNCRSP